MRNIRVWQWRWMNSKSKNLLEVTGRSLKKRMAMWEEENIARVFKFPVNYRTSSKMHFKFPGNFKPFSWNESIVSLWRKRHFFKTLKTAGAVFPRRDVYVWAVGLGVTGHVFAERHHIFALLSVSRWRDFFLYRLDVWQSEWSKDFPQYGGFHGWSIYKPKWMIYGCFYFGGNNHRIPLIWKCPSLKAPRLTKTPRLQLPDPQCARSAHISGIICNWLKNGQND